VKLVVQRALVEVDEQGAPAVAATASSGDQADSVEVFTPLHIDPPFIFLIRDAGTGSILFMGRVEDPRAQSWRAPNGVRVTP
jgi:serpin B